MRSGCCRIWTPWASPIFMSRPSCRRAPEAEMRHKMLLPVLAAQYGEELEGGKLKLIYLQAEGKFAVEYYESRFPIDPQTYPLVFATRPRPVAYSTGQDKVLPAQPELSELRALLSEFNELPPHWDADR